MQKEFKKADLKDGMVVEYRSGGLLLKIGKKLVGTHNTNSMDAYRDDLTHKLIRELDIAKVYKLGAIKNFHDIFKKDFLDIIWEAGVNHMTVYEMQQELEKLTGEKIEVEPSVEEKFGIIVRHCDEGNGCESCCLKDMGLSTKCMFQDELFDVENIEQCYEKVMEDGR